MPSNLPAARAVLAGLVCLGALAACAKKSEPARAVPAAPPSRVISTAPSNTEIIVALGAADMLIAVDDYSALIPGLDAGLPRLDFLRPDAETLVGLAPDLVIANAINRGAGGGAPLDILEKRGARVVYLPVSESLEAIMGDIALVSGLLGREAEGAALVAGMRSELARVDAVAARIGGAERRRVYFEVEPAPHAVTFGRGVFLNELVERVGAANVFADMSGFFVASGEQVIARDPGVILTNVSEITRPVEELRARAGFGAITAVKEKRVFFIGTDESARANHNVIKALKQIAVSVYPEYYAGLWDGPAPEPAAD